MTGQAEEIYEKFPSGYSERDFSWSIAEADPENIEEGKLDGWTYHLRFVKPEEYFNVETPPSPPEYLDHD
jgi:hypothetical protein